MHKKAKTFPLYSKSRIRYFRFIAKHKNSRGEEKHFLFVGKRSLVMIMRIMIIIITNVVTIHKIIIKKIKVGGQKHFQFARKKNSGDGYEDNDYNDYNDNNCSIDVLDNYEKLKGGGQKHFLFVRKRSLLQAESNKGLCSL